MSASINPFEFQTVPAILVEWDGARRLGEVLARRFAARRLMLVTDGGVRDRKSVV